MFTLKKFDNRNQNRICVVDNLGGSYVNIALTLSKYFQKTYYHTVQQNPFPSITWTEVGSGYPEINVINSFWDRLDDFDIIIFPDIYFASWGSHLRKMGKMVWGGSESEYLETNRKLFKEELKNNNMYVAPTQIVKGVNNLITYLKDKKDKWLKISYYRGDFETAHWVNYNYNYISFTDLLHNLGPCEGDIEFLIEDPIESVAEVGFDGYSIDGKFSNNCIWGLEVKDCGYVGKTTTQSLLPKPISLINQQFSPILKKYNHRGFFSTEIRYTKDDKSYFTDPCMRAGSPPSNTYLELINNWDEIIIGGCKGIIVEPRFTAKYGCEIILKSDYLATGFLPVNVPIEYKNNVKLKSSFIKNGSTYIISYRHAGFEMTEFGSVVVVGDNLQQIMNKAIDIAGKIEAYSLTYNVNALNIALDQLKNVEQKLNIKF